MLSEQGGGSGPHVISWVALALGAAVVAAGVAAFGAWALDIPRLASWGLGIYVQPNTALAATAVGASLCLLAIGFRRASAPLAGFALLIGAATLFEHASGVNLGIDRALLFGRTWGSEATVTPGRIGLPASTSLVLLGMGLLLAGSSGAAPRRVAVVLALGAAAIAFLSLNGYLAGAGDLYRIPRFTAIALPTIGMILAAALGLLAAMPDRQPVRTLREGGPTGLLARRALPLIILMPVAIGWLRLKGQDAGFYDSAFGTALRTVAEVGALCVLLWWTLSVLRHNHRALGDSEELNRRIVESTRDCVKVLDLNGRLLSMNRAGQAVLGIDDLRPYLNRPYADVWPPEHRAALDAMILKARMGHTGTYVGFIPSLPGGPSWWELTANPIVGRDGQPERLLVVSRDVTERRREEEARAALVAIVTTSEDAIVSKSLDGIIRSWNAGAERLFGWLSEEAVGKSIELIIPPEYRAEERLILSRLRRGERIAHFETVRMTKTGKPVDVSLSISPIRDDSGQIIGASKVARDITEQKRAESELRLHRERLEQLVAERTAELEASHQRLRTAERMASLGTLSAGLGHDMGNLLIPIRIRLESLAQIDLPERAHEDLTAIRTCAEYLRRLASGLRLLALDPTKTIPDEATELNAWWQDVQGVMGSVLPRGVALEASMPELPCHVRITKAALTQAVFNLVQNAGDAMKERASGRIAVTARCKDRRVELIVQDNGPGMTPEVRARCLEPYFTTKARGISTGLGLALVAGLIRDAGGTVDLQTEPGKGAAFTLSLPHADPPGADAAREARRIALVDVADTRMRSIIVRELDALGYDAAAEDAGAPALAVLDDPARVTEFPPDVRILLLSGEPPEPRAAMASLNGRPTIIGVRQALRRLAQRGPEPVGGPPPPAAVQETPA